MRYFLIFLLSPLLCSCSLFEKDLTSYYKKVEDEGKIITALEEAQEIVEIQYYYVRPDQIVPVKEEYKNSLVLLSRGQEKYIEVLGNEFKGKPDEFIKHIAAPFKTSNPLKNESIIDKSEFQIKVSLNIEDKKNVVYKANRISNLRVKFNLENDDINFLKFNNIQTKYEVLDFGKLTNTNAQNISLNAGADIVVGTTANKFNDGGNMTNTATQSNAPTLGGAFTSSNSNTQEVLLTKRVLSQNAALTSRFAYISLEGTPTNNLEGPLNIEFTLKSNLIHEHKLAKFDDLFKNGEPIKQEKVKHYTVYYQIPYLKEDVFISMTYDFIYREVKKNHKTVTESDDHIIYHLGKPNRKIPLICLKKEDMKMNVYYLYDEKKEMYLGENGVELPFTTFDGADSFRKWLLLSKSQQIQNKPLTLGGVNEGQVFPLPPVDELNLIIQPVNLYEQNEYKEPAKPLVKKK